jgi:hypothetical protein
MSAVCAISGQGLKPRVQWCRGGEFNGPPGPYARIKSAIDAVFTCHIKPNLAFWRPHGEASVVVLLLRRGPRAVFWRVTSVYVGSLYRKVIGVSARFGPLCKVLEVGPFGANSYAASSVVRPLGASGPQASSPHVFPNAVDAGSGFSVRSAALAGLPGGLASARLGFVASKVRPDNVANGSASAFATPKGRAPDGVSALRYNAPKPEGPASKVYKSRVFCHKPIYKDGAGLAIGDFV